MITLPFDPVAFTIGSLEVRWYGIFIALAVFWLIFWMWWQVRKGAKLTVDNVLTLALVGIPSAVIVSRLLHVIDNIVVAKIHPELALSGQVFDYSQDWSRIIGGEGLTAWGAVLGAALGVWIYAKITKMQIGYIFDLVAPGVILAQAIGRLGCLFNGCCYGAPTDGEFGFLYTCPTSLAYGAGVTQPTVPYEILFNVAAFAVLFKLRGKLKPDGSLFALYLSLYSVWRLGIDFLRTGTPFILNLHQAQVISIIILLVAVPWMIKHTRWAKKEEPVPAVGEPPSPEGPPPLQ